jgi:tmRNA-binding protein
VENTFETTINVFPNPTDGKVSVLLGRDYDEIELSVRNAMGKLVFQKHYFNTNRIDLNLNVAKGIYLIELRETQGRRSLIKIVKE